jgi:hypothetical protein
MEKGKELMQIHDQRNGVINGVAAYGSNLVRAMIERKQSQESFNSDYE